MSDIGLFMADDFIEKDLFDKRIESLTEESNSSSDKKIKIIKVIFWLLCLIMIGEFVYYKFVMPCFQSPKVTVNGQEKYSAQEIATKLLTMNSTNWVNFDVNQATAILASEPGIENVVVEKHFPDKIIITVTERIPVAITFVVEENHTYPVMIDKNGVLFSGKKNMETEYLPIISGLPVEYMSGGMRIPQKYRPLIEQINKIRESKANYFAGISEICVVSKDSGNYELEIIPSESKVKVLTDRILNEHALNYMMVVLDVVKKINADVSEIDLRYGSISYRTK